MTRQPKILVVCQHFWPEAFRINDICDFLVEKSCEVEVLCGLPNYPGGKLFEGYSLLRQRRQHRNGVEIHRALEIPRGSNTNVRVFLNYISFPLFSLLHIPRLLLKRYDKIVLYQLSPVMMSIAGIIVGKVKGVQTTMYVLDLWPENLFSVLKLKSRFWRAVATKVSHWHYRQVDKLVVLSEQMKAKLCTVTGISHDKIIVVPQACEKIYEVDMQDEELSQRFAGKFVILFTGNISPAQSFLTIIEAAKSLRDAGFSDICWVIVGDGMSRAWLEAKVREENLQPYFHFDGFKPLTEIPRYTTRADLLVGCLVSSDLLEATIPAKVMSYLAAGRPLVLAMDGEVRELINSKVQCGYAGPTEDAQQLAENIRKVYSLSKQERDAMGARGRSYHLAHFERNLQLERLYQFIMS